MRADRFIGKIDTAKELTFLVEHNKFSDWTDDVYKGMLGYGHGQGRGLGYE